MLQIQSKRFYLDVKQNRRGRFIKVAEVNVRKKKLVADFMLFFVFGAVRPSFRQIVNNSPLIVANFVCRLEPMEDAVKYF